MHTCVFPPSLLNALYLPELDSIKLDGSCPENELESAYRKLKTESNSYLLNYLLQKVKKFDNTKLLEQIFIDPNSPSLNNPSIPNLKDPNFDESIFFTSSDLDYLKSKIFRDTKPLPAIKSDLQKLDYIKRRKLKEQLLSRFTSKSKIDNVFTFIGKRCQTLTEISLNGLYLTDNYGASLSNLENLKKLHITGSEYPSLEFTGSSICSSITRNATKITDKFFENICMNPRQTITDFLFNDFRRESENSEAISAEKLSKFISKRMSVVAEKVFIRTNNLNDVLLKDIFDTCIRLEEFTVISVQANSTNVSDSVFHVAAKHDRFQHLKKLKLVNLANLRIYKGQHSWIDGNCVLKVMPRLRLLSIQGNPYADIAKLSGIVERLNLQHEKARMIDAQKEEGGLGKMVGESISNFVELQIDSEDE